MSSTTHPNNELVPTKTLGKKCMVLITAPHTDKSLFWSRRVWHRGVKYKAFSSISKAADKITSSHSLKFLLEPVCKEFKLKVMLNTHKLLQNSLERTGVKFGERAKLNNAGMFHSERA
ncbi:hypothetical protein QTO34_017826 [Cnephaeus nilssonii]|uniref:Uncharacterized protein n=1 Tax=Cnephaeus nilssonii TaxID=3371016 RepID=A0AA40I2L7_CNENI|nr:hypothetical protein QTO34_017826 [Eptesicus nilssonii]